MTDRISLHGLRVMARHGVLAHEKERAQPFQIDLDLVVDTRLAGASDNLVDTVSYGDIARVVSAVVAQEQHQLLERVAQRIAEVVLSNTQVISVTVKVTKLRPPVPVDLSAASVTITRP